MARPVGWILEAGDRDRLLTLFPPRYARTIAHHVTLWGHREKAALPQPARLAVVGHADAATGIEALVVTVDGTTERPDEKIYHCTWSLDPDSGKRPVDSNALIAEQGWEAVDPVPFDASPGYTR